MASKDSSSVGILACGVQGKSNLEALACEFDIKKVKAFDIYPKVSKKFASEMSELLDLEIEIVNNPNEAVIDLDMVVTSYPMLKNPEPTIEAGWLAEGSFVSSISRLFSRYT